MEIYSWENYRTKWWLFQLAMLEQLRIPRRYQPTVHSYIPRISWTSHWYSSRSQKIIWKFCHTLTHISPKTHLSLSLSPSHSPTVQAQTQGEPTAQPPKYVWAHIFDNHHCIRNLSHALHLYHVSTDVAGKLMFISDEVFETNKCWHVLTPILTDSFHAVPCRERFPRPSVQWAAWERSARGLRGSARRCWGLSESWTWAMSRHYLKVNHH